MFADCQFHYYPVFDRIVVKPPPQREFRKPKAVIERNRTAIRDSDVEPNRFNQFRNASFYKFFKKDRSATTALKRFAYTYVVNFRIEMCLRGGAQDADESPEISPLPALPARGEGETARAVPATECGRESPLPEKQHEQTMRGMKGKQARLIVDGAHGPEEDEAPGGGGAPPPNA